MKTIAKLTATAMMFGLMLPAVAQTSPRFERRIENRQNRQQQRIGNGAISGQLTANETRKLERQEAVLDRRIDRMDNNGISRKEAARIEHAQDRMSRKIYREKHDNQVQLRASGPITARQRSQQVRIGQGIRSGQLTPAEAARLERQETRLNSRIRHERRDGNGLNMRERARINHRQDQMSRRIYRQKHDRQRR